MWIFVVVGDVSVCLLVNFHSDVVGPLLLTPEKTFAVPGMPCSLEGFHATLHAALSEMAGTVNLVEGPLLEMVASTMEAVPRLINS